jgi:hypothetical protein
MQDEPSYTLTSRTPSQGDTAQKAGSTEYLAHLITVLAELAAAGDVDAIRMHYERHKGVSHG